MKLFDMHTHCFPDALAPKALPLLASVCKSPYYTNGTFNDLKQKMKEAGCAGAMILHIATKPTQMTSVNNFAAACQTDGFYSFGSVFPTAANAADELERIKSLGLKGVKLHPDYQGFFADDPAVFSVYDAAAELKLPIVFHTGYDPYSPETVHCPPHVLAQIADLFPKLTIVAAHFGGMRMDEEAEKCLFRKENVYFDTAYASYSVTPRRCGELVRKFGAEKIFFGTDSPWSTVEAELRLLQQSGISDKDMELICSKNADRVFSLDLSQPD